MKKVEAVANYFISIGLFEDEEYMTNLRLQKLMYYAQACSLKMFGAPLFDEQIEAWGYGPVVPTIYHKYEKYGKNSITQVDSDFSIEIFTDKEMELLAAVMAYYGNYSTSGLVNLTHSSGGAWEQAYNRPDKHISPAEMAADKTVKNLRLDIDEQEAGFYNASGTYVLPASWRDA